MSMRLACPECEHDFPFSGGAETCCPKCGSTVRTDDAIVPLDAVEEVVPPPSQKRRPEKGPTETSLPKAKRLVPAGDAKKQPSAKPDAELPRAQALTPSKRTGNKSPGAQGPKSSENRSPESTATANAADDDTFELAPLEPETKRPAAGTEFNFGAPTRPAARRGRGRKKSASPTPSATRPESPAAKKALPLPLILGAIGGGILLLVVVVAISFAVFGGSDDSTASADPSSAGSGSGTDSNNAAGVDPPSNETGTVVAPPVPSERAMTSAQIRSIWNRIGDSTVSLVAEKPGGTEEGMGFVVDSRGWIATSRHLVDGASRVRVKFSLDRSDGKVVDSLGLIGASSDYDLAIISVGVSAVRSAISLRLDSSWQPDAGLPVAVCRPPESSDSWLQGCSAVGTLDNERLPPSSKAVARARGMDQSPVIWIEFDAKNISATRCTGSPVVTKDGTVIGINSILSASATSGYAIPVSHLENLMVAATGDPKSFDADGLPRVAAADSGTDPAADPEQEPQSDPSSSEPGQLERPGAQDPEPANPEPADPAVVSDDIDELFNEAKQLKWRPSSAREYATLQRLAGQITRAFFAERDGVGAEAERAKAIKASGNVLAHLSSIQWGTDAQLTAVNELAAEEYGKSDVGLFAYCKVVGRQENVPRVNNRSVLLMKLVGVDHYIMLPVKEGAEQISRGTYWLVMGVPQRTIQFNVQLNDKQIRAIVIEAARLLEKPVKSNP